jgi:hypothetical protein
MLGRAVGALGRWRAAAVALRGGCRVAMAVVVVVMVVMVVVVSMSLRNPVRTGFPSRGSMALVPGLSVAAATRAVSAQAPLTRPSSRVLGCRPGVAVVVVGATSRGIPRSAWRRRRWPGVVVDALSRALPSPVSVSVPSRRFLWSPLVYFLGSSRASHVGGMVIRSGRDAASKRSAV